jgi:hypothetical protein
LVHQLPIAGRNRHKRFRTHELFSRRVFTRRYCGLFFTGEKSVRPCFDSAASHVAHITKGAGAFMKGKLFTEFFELVDDRFSFETSERLIEMSHLPSEGIYTAVGTYDSQEMATLVSNLSTLTGVPVPDLLKEFGRHLFKRFLTSFPDFFEGITSSLEFLPRVDSFVHLEVRRLYPDAKLPSFTCTKPKPGAMLMTYRSKRRLSDLAEGLILACIDHFGESLVVRRETDRNDPTETRFVIMPA